MCKPISGQDKYVYYRGNAYALLEPQGVFDLKTHGLKSKSNTAEHTYYVHNGRLELDALETPSPLSFSGIKGWFTSSPPAINGVLPDHNGNEAITYTNIQLPLTFTGQLVLAAPNTASGEMLYTLFFDKGKLVKTIKNGTEVIDCCINPKSTDRDIRAISASLQPATCTAGGKLYKGENDSYWYAHSDALHLVQRIMHDHITLFQNWNDERYNVPDAMKSSLVNALPQSSAGHITIHTHMVLQDGNTAFGELRLYKHPPVDLPDSLLYMVSDLKSISPVLSPKQSEVVPQVEWVPSITDPVMVIGRWDE